MVSVRLLLAPAEPPENSCRINRVFSIFLLLPVMAIGNLQRKTIGKCVRQLNCGILGAVGHCEEFDPVLVHRAKMEEKDFLVQMGVCDVVPRSVVAEKGAVLFAPDGSQSTRVRTTLHNCESGGLHRSFVVVMVANTSAPQRRLTWR